MPLNFLKKYMLKYWYLYLPLLLVMLLGIALNLSVAWFLSAVTNVAVIQDASLWSGLITAGTAILVLLGVNTFVDTYLKAKVSGLIRHDLRQQTMKALLSSDQAFYDHHHSGQLLTTITNDNNVVGEALGDTMMELIKNPLMAICSFTYLLYINWRLAIICILIGPMTLLIASILGKRIRTMSTKLQDTVGRSSAFLQDVLSSSIVFKVFSLESTFRSKYRVLSGQILKLDIKKGKVNSILDSSVQLVSMSAFIVAFLIGAYFVSQGDMSIGSLLAFIQLMNYLIMPFTVFAALWGSLQHSLGAADRISKILEQPPESSSAPSNIHTEIKTSFNNLKLNNISFGYEDTTLIDQISMEIKPGEFVAIVGPSGSGKSTLFKLLLNLYPINSGSISINDRAYHSLDNAQIRDYFSLVPQDAQLFSGSIYENIAYGNMHAAEEQIIQAAKDANAYEFIMQLPHGFQTEIGERGASLSGGQRQRIAIARAILKNAPVLLLDEATSALDNHSEELVQSALQRMMSHKTTLVIAHRLSTIERADRIYVLSQGRMVECGTHDELMSNRSHYFELHTKSLQKEPNEALTSQFTAAAES